MSNDIGEQYAYRREGHTRVEKGQPLVTHLNEGWVFDRVSRKAYGNSTGRVAVYRRCPDATLRSGSAIRFECVHIWHTDGRERREFFPHVFDLYLGDERGCEL